MSETAKRKVSPRKIVSWMLLLVAVPCLLLLGSAVWNERKYLLISLLIILVSMGAFALRFEHRKPQARELVVLAVMVALGVVSRGAFFFAPQVKPVAAVAILTAVAFGPESGFITGAAIMLISNMLFGQGTWTPWQMMGLALTGFFAGLLFSKGPLARSRIGITIYGFLSCILIYGPIVDLYSLLSFSAAINWANITMIAISGFWFNLVFGVTTAVLLFILEKPILEKLDRVRIKYGLME